MEGGWARSRAGRALAIGATMLVLVWRPAGVHAVTAAPGSPVHDVSGTAATAEGEESIAVNPLDPQNVIVGSNQFTPLIAGAGEIPVGPSGTQQAGVWASHDGGNTWTGGTMNRGGFGPVTVPRPARPLVGGEFADVGNFIGSDQSVVYDRHGTAYFESILSGFGPATGGDIEVLVHRSIDGGTSWQPPVVAFSQNQTGILIDRPFLAVDTSGGPRDGTLYLGWETQFYAPAPAAVYVRSSTDHGATWGPVRRVDDDAHKAMWDPREQPVVGADGALYIVYDSSPTATPLPDDVGAADVQVYVARSDDGGRSFARHLVEPHAHRLSDPYEAIPAVEELIVAIATDPRRPGHLAIAWPDARSGEGRVLMRTSEDGGAHWSSLVDVGDDAPGSGNQHDHAALAYLPDGRVAALWRDRRNGGGGFGGAFDIFARAFDTAATPTPSSPVARLTTSPQPPTTFPTGVQPSEYLAVTAGPEGLTASWDQMAGSLPDNVERRVPLSAFADPAAPAVAGSSRTAGARAATTPNTSGAASAPVAGLLVLGWLPLAVIRRARSASMVHNGGCG